MQENLSAIAGAMISQIMGRAKKLTPSKRLQAIKDVTIPGLNDYKSQLRTALAVIASESINQARKEVPKAKNIKLAEGIGYADFELDEFDGLPPRLQKKIMTESQLVIDDQTNSLEKAIYFQFAHSHDSTDSLDQIENDLADSVEEYVTGSSLEGGSGIMAADTINTARDEFFTDDDVKKQLDAVQIVNGDPVTNICETLNGVIFSLDDPLADRFTPPYHWKCKSYLVAILAGDLGDREIEDLSAYANLEDEMQFTEEVSRTVKFLTESNSHSH